jgi:hypothetical protein
MCQENSDHGDQQDRFNWPGHAAAYHGRSGLSSSVQDQPVTAHSGHGSERYMDTMEVPVYRPSFQVGQKWGNNPC